MINRFDCYEVLFSLKKQGVDVERQLKLLSTSPSVPLEVIRFINEQRPLNVTSFYETLRKKNNQKASKLYKNIVVETHSNPLEVVKTASSLLTQIVIASEKLPKEEVSSFYSQTRAKELTIALNEYFLNGDIQKVLDELKRIKEDIKILESKGE